MSQQPISIAIDEALDDALAALAETHFNELTTALTETELLLCALPAGERPAAMTIATPRLTLKIEFDHQHLRYVLAEISAPDPEPDPPPVLATIVRSEIHMACDSVEGRSSFALKNRYLRDYALPEPDYALPALIDGHALFNGVADRIKMTQPAPELNV